MADATPNLLDALGAVAGKLGPGMLGSLIALRWLPESTTRLDRLIAVVGGIASSAYFGQAIAELPHETTVTARLKRHKHDTGWRGRVARWVAAHLLDAFDPDGRHI